MSAETTVTTKPETTIQYKPWPTTWTAPTSCFATDNYYYVLYGDSDDGLFSNVYGTPTPVFDGNTPVGDCFPPSFSIYQPYITDAAECPRGYTRACATAGPKSNGEPVSTLTCCPSVTDDAFSFMCRPHQYGCHATSTEDTPWVGIETNIGIKTPTETYVTRTPGKGEGVEAWGIKLLVVSPPSTSATSTHTSKAPKKTGTSAEESSGPGSTSAPSLSGPAIAGIVVGAAAFIALLGIGAFFLFRNKRSSKKSSDAASAAHTASSTQKEWPQYHPQGAYYYQYPNYQQQGPQELAGWRNETPSELPSRESVHR